MYWLLTFSIPGRCRWARRAGRPPAEGREEARFMSQARLHANE